MNTTKTTSEIEATVLRAVRSSIEEYFKEQFQKDDCRKKEFATVDKLTGEFLSKKLKNVEALGNDVDVDEVKIMVSCDNATYPVLRSVAATWKTGGLFKKTVKGVFFVWHPGLTDSSTAVTLAEFNGLLNANGLEDMASSVNWIGTATADVDIKAVRETVSEDLPWFGNDETCDVNDNLKSITFDKANMALVLRVESRD